MDKDLLEFHEKMKKLGKEMPEELLEEIDGIISLPVVDVEKAMCESVEEWEEMARINEEDFGVLMVRTLVNRGMMYFTLENGEWKANVPEVDEDAAYPNIPLIVSQFLWYNEGDAEATLRRMQMMAKENSFSVLEENLPYRGMAWFLQEYQWLESPLADEEESEMTFEQVTKLKKLVNTTKRFADMSLKEFMADQNIILKKGGSK